MYLWLRLEDHSRIISEGGFSLRKKNHIYTGLWGVVTNWRERKKEHLEHWQNGFSNKKKQNKESKTEQFVVKLLIKKK